MAFFTGPITAQRFHVLGVNGDLFGPDHLRDLAEHLIGKRKPDGDGTEFGWTASEHILDRDFDLEKNIIEDMLLFALRVDTNKPPADLLKAYYLQDLKALAKGNPSGRPSKRQKREAKESARDRIEQEAKDGRFIKRKAIECLWDRQRQELYFGATGTTHIERLAQLFKETFGGTLEPITSGEMAMRLEKINAINNITAAQFTPDAPAGTFSATSSCSGSGTSRKRRNSRSATSPKPRSCSPTSSGSTARAASAATMPSPTSAQPRCPRPSAPSSAASCRGRLAWSSSATASSLNST